MNLTFDLFIFDFDGTLVDSRRNVANSLNFALSEVGLQEVNPELVYPLIGKLTLDDTFKRFYPQLDSLQMGTLMQVFRQYQRDHVEAEVVFFPDAISTLKTLQERGKHLAIVSTKQVQQLTYMLDVFGVHDLFQVVCGLGSLSKMKPDRACIEFVWRCLNVQSDLCGSVMVGDSEIDVATAQNAGIEMIAVGHGVDSLDYLKEKGATYTVQSLSELLRFA